jgi:chromate transport protein ChrA
MSLRFAYSGMEPREAWSVRRDDLGDVRAVLSKQGFEKGLSLANAVPGFLLSNLAVFSGIRSCGARLAVPAILAVVLSLQPVTLGMLVMMVIRMAPRSLNSRNQVAIAAAAAAMLPFFSAHPLVLLPVR